MAKENYGTSYDRICLYVIIYNISVRPDGDQTYFAIIGMITRCQC